MQPSLLRVQGLHAVRTKRHLRLLVIAPVLIMMMMMITIPLVTPHAHAHPFIDMTIPSTAQNAPVGTDEIVVFFSEAVDIDYSEIRVIDDKGDRIDNRDLEYYEDETSLIVSTPPLEQGVYTVSTKVLSKVDGHLVPGVFIFSVGDVTIDSKLLEQESQSELIFLPEAGAEFPGILGQTIVLGAAVAALAVWSTNAKRDYTARTRQGDSDDISWTATNDRHHNRLVQVMGAGMLLVLASDVFIIILQMARLEAGLFETIQTEFGTIWLVRMIATLALAGAWFATHRAEGQSRQRIMYAVMLAVVLVIMTTSSMSGHGAATGDAWPTILDYAHNIVAGIWIGGIIYTLFVLLPVLSGLTSKHKEMLSLMMIPRFSAIFIISVGVVIVTGPTLLWMLEGDVGLITESVFGRLIILKVAIASGMVCTGALIQSRIQKRAEKDIVASRQTTVHASLVKTLRVDVALGISLLVVVALLTNGTLPAGEIRTVEAQKIFTGLDITEYSENAVFDITITPFHTGENLITVSVFDGGGNGALADLDKVKVKASNPDSGIPPIEVEMTEYTHDTDTNTALGISSYRGEMTLAFSGRWLVEVEAQRLDNANEVVLLDIRVKPSLSNLDVTLTEYIMPVNDTSPFHAVYDRAGGMWFTDAAKPRLWKADTDTGEIVSFVFNGTGSSFVTYNGHDGNIWFTDSRGGQIGYTDIQGKNITTIIVPDFESMAITTNPTAERAMPFFIEAGPDGDIWITIINKGMIAVYHTSTEEWSEIHLQGRNTLPFALETGPDGMMWYTATGTGEVGYVDPATHQITRVIDGVESAGMVQAIGDANDNDTSVLRAPEALLFERGSMGTGLWIAEHTGLAITRYDPILDVLERHHISDPDALPFGMVFDRYGDVWFAEHTIDKIGVLDPYTGEIMQISIPTTTSFVQFLETDGNGDIWFAEQRAGKIGKITITEKPSTYRIPEDIAADALSYDTSSIQYADLVSPLMALGVLATSVFYIKAVNDGRRLGKLLMDQGNQSP